MTTSEILNKLRNGFLSAALDNKAVINNYVSSVLDMRVEDISEQDIDNIGEILDIANIVYENADLDDDEQIIDHGIYDKLVELYCRFRRPKVGGEIVNFVDTHVNDEIETELRNPLTMLEDYKIDTMLFKEELFRQQYTPKHYYAYDNSNLRCPIAYNVVGDGGRNTRHEHPHLVGTLQKCKFVLISQAEAKGVLDDSNVKVLERDFFNLHFERGWLIGGDIIKGIISLKYDGISVDITVGRVKYADGYRVEAINGTTRGDAINEVGKDVTHVIGGYHFYNANPDLFATEIGLKVEAVMTYSNLHAYNIERERNYKNPRSAISSIFSSNEGWRYMKYITLVPLELDIPKDHDDSRLSEIEFMNEQLTTGEYFRYAVIEGDYLSALFQIKKFTDEAETSRDIIPIMYDGVVFEYTEVRLREGLGRKDAINLYAKAIKFNPIRKYTTFRGYQYTVGVNGVVTPMIYYDPIEFMGTTHNHSTGSSYGRFKNLELRLGDMLIVDYVNEVMPYVTKPDNEHNRNNTNPPEEFIKECPFCSKPLVQVSDKTIKCANNHCPERVKSKMANMIDKLEITDIAENSVDKIPFRSFKDMMNCSLEDLSLLGEANSLKFYEQIVDMRSRLIPDYVAVGSLGFSNIGRTLWKTILTNISLNEIVKLVYDNPDLLRTNLLAIKGIGTKIVDTIFDELDMFIDDMMYICSMMNVVASKGKVLGKKIRCTGFRDKALMEELRREGFDADDKASVTKDTFLLLVNSITNDSNGGKYKNAMKYGVKIVERSEFMSNKDKYLKGEN